MPRTFIECQDLDWFAIDQDGCIALLASGGSPFVPLCYQHRVDLAFEIAEHVHQLPVIGSHQIANGQPSTWRVESWTSVSDRGLYGYDFDHESGSEYHLFTKPTVLPVRFNPSNFSWVSLLPVYKGSFGSSEPIISQQVTAWFPASL